MKIFFDTSVLVPVFYADHPHHDFSSRAFLAANKSDFCARRSLGEVYATVTGLPVRPRITGPNGKKFIDQIRARLTLVSLTDDEYIAALDLASTFITGGTTYDLLIAQCAVKADADVLLTWNRRHFLRFGGNIARLVQTPADFLCAPL